MIYLLESIFFLFRTKGHHSIAKYLYFSLLISIISAYMVGRQPSFEPYVLGWTIYTAILLVLLFDSYKGFSSVQTFSFEKIGRKRLNIIEKITSVIGYVTLLISIYIIYKVFALLLLGAISAEEHKNDGGAAELFATLVPHAFMTWTYLFSPLGYFFLFLHFYYLINRKILKAIKFFILSLLLVTSGLTALSRSSTVTYILLYAGIFYYIMPLLTSKIKKKFAIVVVIIAIGIFSALLVISNDRFSEKFYKNSLNEAILDEKDYPVLFSLFDYYGQWPEYGPIMMDLHMGHDIYWGLYNCSGLAQQIMRYKDPKFDEKLEKSLDKTIGHYQVMFHGPIARLFLDFGFIGTIFFILLYAKIVRHFSCPRGILELKGLIMLPVLLPFAVQFFCGNAFAYISLDLGLIYNYILMNIIQERRRIIISKTS